MKPELVLNLKDGDKPEEKLREWLDAYTSYAGEYTNTEELAEMLSARAKKAYELILERGVSDMATSSHDEAFYEESERVRAAEDAELDGDFPLGNTEDAEFANAYFTVDALAGIQLGKTNLIDCGEYTEYNYGALVRKGFIAEQNGKWLEAARCYEGVSVSETVQDREYMCRRKARAEGERLYSEAQAHMESGEWSDVFYLLECAADMGNPEAETDLGLARAYGNFGAYRDIEEALTYLRHAANGGCARAAFEICELYDSGVSIDAQEAMEMCEKAAQAGIKKAEARLEDGFDLRPIREILQEQIDKGNIDALWLMEQQCEREGDIEAASAWLDKALEAEQTDALLAMAEVYSDESDKEHYDDEQAEHYYRRAAKRAR